MAQLGVVPGVIPDPPYPVTVRAGNYLFSLDYERVKVSDTWTLAPADVRPWLLMIWVMSWLRIPCATYTDDDELIAAAIGMPLGQFQTHRKVLMRGWRRCSDGRLYHDYLTTRVLEMMAGRDEYRSRQKRHRQKRTQQATEYKGVTRDIRVTPRLSRADVDVDVDVEPVVDVAITSLRGQVVAKSDAPPAAPPDGRDKPKKKPATRLPEGWSLPDEWRDWAVRVHKLDPQRAVRISLAFRDYWHAKPKDATKLDWFATWRNWVRKDCGDA